MEGPLKDSLPSNIGELAGIRPNSITAETKYRFFDRLKDTVARKGWLRGLPDLFRGRQAGVERVIATVEKADVPEGTDPFDHCEEINRKVENGLGTETRKILGENREVLEVIQTIYHSDNGEVFKVYVNTPEGKNKRYIVKKEDGSFECQENDPQTGKLSRARNYDTDGCLLSDAHYYHEYDEKKRERKTRFRHDLYTVLDGKSILSNSADEIVEYDDRHWITSSSRINRSYGVGIYQQDTRVETRENYTYTTSSEGVNIRKKHTDIKTYASHDSSDLKYEEIDDEVYRDEIRESKRNTSRAYEKTAQGVRLIEEAYIDSIPQIRDQQTRFLPYLSRITRFEYDNGSTEPIRKRVFNRLNNQKIDYRKRGNEDPRPKRGEEKDWIAETVSV